MGWFWAEPTPPAAAASLAEPSSSPPPSRRRPGSSCPIHQKSGGGGGGPLFDPPGRRAPPACPITHGSAERRSFRQADEASILSHLNPLNHMPRDLSQGRAPGQTHALPTTRDLSTIPRGAPSSGSGSGSGDGGNWEYPSPQQMYNALLRKGYADTDPTAIESMVAVHNFLNEGAWAEIVGWEERFRGGLLKGWRICERGEENAGRIERRMRDGTEAEPRLVRFQGRPGEMTPRAAMLQILGKVHPARFGTEPPFDRHDWYVSRTMAGQTREVRYVIDYYSGPPEPTGEPVFYLDVRPAATLTGAAERFIRWGGDVWWRAAGGEARDRPWLNWGGAQTK